jgi:hypothetical protein
VVLAEAMSTTSTMTPFVGGTSRLPAKTPNWSSGPSLE